MTPLSRITIPQIEEMTRDGLIEIWTGKLGYALPKRTATSYLRRAVAFEVQARQQGDLTKTERRVFTRAAERAFRPSPGPEGRILSAPDPASQAKSKSLPISGVRLRPGTTLLREWNGRTYEVRRTDGGYVFDGQTYKSLSKIAQRITGAHWSGPRFFGLVKAPSAKQAGAGT